MIIVPQRSLAWPNGGTIFLGIYISFEYSPVYWLYYEMLVISLGFRRAAASEHSASNSMVLEEDDNVVYKRLDTSKGEQLNHIMSRCIDIDTVD
jgi:hypothetical protein